MAYTPMAAQDRVVAAPVNSQGKSRLWRPRTLKVLLLVAGVATLLGATLLFAIDLTSDSPPLVDPTRLVEAAEVAAPAAEDSPRTAGAQHVPSHGVGWRGDPPVAVPSQDQMSSRLPAMSLARASLSRQSPWLSASPPPPPATTVRAVLGTEVLSRYQSLRVMYQLFDDDGNTRVDTRNSPWLDYGEGRILRCGPPDEISGIGECAGLLTGHSFAAAAEVPLSLLWPGPASVALPHFASVRCLRDPKWVQE
jgi:hypothetical protein